MRYQQIKPTNVPLTKSELDTRTRLELIRVLQAEQGFAMRPFPGGHKGLTLEANGLLDPAGEAYLDMVTSNGLSAKPGDRLVLSRHQVRSQQDHLRLKWRSRSQAQIPAPHPNRRGARCDGTGSAGRRDDAGWFAAHTRHFTGHVPELTGAEVKSLLAPLISFDVKTPIQAYTDTLPTKLKEAILNHQVWVGMSTDMVLYRQGAAGWQVA